MMTEMILSVPGVDVRRPQSHEEWLELRRGFVGGSDVAGIMGVSPWATPFTVWCEKMGVSAKKETAAMRYGIEQENAILETAQDILGADAKIYTSPATYVAGNRGANLDGLADVDGRMIGIEIKTTSDRRPWQEVPEFYNLQVQHYMNVCNLSVFLLIVKGRGWRDHFFINQDLPLQDKIKKAISDFWYFVEQKVSPYLPVLVDRREEPYILAASRAGMLGMQIENMAFDGACRDYLDLKKRIKKLEAEANYLKNLILLGIGSGQERNGVQYAGQINVVSMHRFDLAKFREEQPDLYEEYLTRVFREDLAVEKVGSEDA